MKKQKGILPLLILSVFAIVIYSSNELFQLHPLQFSISDETGYTVAFQGPRATFYGVSFNPYGTGITHYSKTDIHSGVSLSSFGVGLAFDPDGATSGKPNLIGEETDVYEPTGVTNPQANYTWVAGNDTYVMYQYVLRYFFSVSAEWDGSVTLFGATGEACPQNQYLGGINEYSNLHLWFKLDMTPTWYIAGTDDTAYFAVAKVALTHGKNAVMSSKDNLGNVVAPRPSESVAPELGDSIVQIYSVPWGDESGVSPVGSTPYTYNGKILNPTYFRNSVYFYVNLAKFGVYGDINAASLQFWCKGDVVAYEMDITVFVIGQWKPHNIHDDPIEYIRYILSQLALSVLSIAQAIAFSPFGLLIITIAIFLILIFFAPAVLMAIIGAFTGGKKKR